MRTLPHGSWPSPVGPTDLVAGAGTPSAPISDGGLVHFLTTRPESGARVLLCRREADATVSDLSPEWMSVRSRVHEYGGGAHAVRDGVVLAVDFTTQRLWRLDGDEPVALTPEVDDAAVRWSSVAVDTRRGVCFAVREDHRDLGVEPVNEVVRLPLEPSPWPSWGEVVVAGRRRAVPRTDADDAGDPVLPDFVTDPVVSPDGEHLAWLQWSHPGMPWDAGRVHVGRLDAAGDLTTSWAVAHGDGSASEPVWLPDGRLAFLADPGGWAVPHVVEAREDAEPVALLGPGLEHGLPGWQLRTRSMTALADGRLAVVRTVDGVAGLVLVDPSTREVTEVPLDVVAATGLAPHGDGLVAELGHRTDGWTTAAIALDVSPDSDPDGDPDSAPDSRLDVVARRGVVPEAAYVATPQAVSWPGSGGVTAHGFLHLPTHPDVTGPEGALPPLVVVAHGGPTSATTTVPSPRVALLTSRGIAVLDVNYGGSTGYGRDYRERLRGQWGVVDVEDAVLGARHLADQGVVDGDRLGVLGGSAGGYIVYAAVAFHDVFTAGISYFGVADPSLLAQETHKMESRYTDGLIGPWPAARATYDARSPLVHVDRIEAPLLLLQGLEDRVVPPGQTTAIAEALRSRGRDVEVVEFEGEGHGFRVPANIVAATRAELAFLGRLWGFEADLGGDGA